MTAPLAGRRVLVTRTREQAAGLVDVLHSHGAEVVVVPLIATEPTVPPEAISAAATSLGEAPPPRWVVFTSATAVRLVLGVVEAAAFTGISVAAVGVATAAALIRAAVTPALMPERASGETLAATLVDHGVSGATVWLPGAEGAGEHLAALLRSAGADVRVQHIYRSAMPPDASRRLAAALRSGIDMVTLTSGSTARHLIAALGDGRLPRDVAVACIGEQTAVAARASGLHVDVIATEQSAAGLAAAIASHFVQPLL